MDQTGLTKHLRPAQGHVGGVDSVYCKHIEVWCGPSARCPVCPAGTWPGARGAQVSMYQRQPGAALSPRNEAAMACTDWQGKRRRGNGTSGLTFEQCRAADRLATCAWSWFNRM